jgi:hypothetical protein
VNWRYPVLMEATAARDQVSLYVALFALSAVVIFWLMRNSKVRYFAAAVYLVFWISILIMFGFSS